MEENAKTSIPTPDTLMAMMGEVAKNKECVFVTWLKEHGDEYRVPLYDILYTDKVSWHRAAVLVQSLGIDRSHTTIGTHRHKRCRSCNQFFEVAT